ncbi:DUF5916 domain-containing protein [Zhouia sp. PK063]|uniref:DUF5916 domain-containing protein n=1 Tax=Zhouia sp. PK063 TaxID=3373602 RepID=UPI0037AB495F
MLFFVQLVMAQKAESDSIFRKKINALRISTPPKIDGILDDAAWKNAPIATNFVERMPNNGKPIPDSLKTEVKVLYDDLGIYFGAVMHDPSPDKIAKELTERDQIGNDDFFFILLNGYNDHQQSLEFAVTAAGVQWDSKLTNDGEDDSWNAVWYSAAQINNDNWVVEVFIPYSQLRFPQKNVQLWGLNMERDFRRERKRFSWNHVDNTKGSYTLYDGEIHGIKNVDTPTRLSFQPYLSTYVTNYDGKSDVNVNGGMDLKYGINDAFTLDMILIPDFGQAKFDETVLNLSAFEVQYDEQRPFFTEGTELFNKGGLFYSRRVGNAPTGKITLKENEEVVNSPAKVDLINAVKVSGRTDKGLGIGVFNAVTERTYATVQNTITGKKRDELVEPLANYNVMVFDQRFHENSSVSIVNTNVTREGDFRDANATGVYMNLTNKKNSFNYYASAEGSWVMDHGTDFGMEASASVAKISGKHRVTGEVTLRTKDYNINDLGYSSTTNFINYYGYYGYRILQPKGNFNQLYLNFNLNYSRRFEPDLYNEFEFNFNSNFTTKNFFVFGGGFETTPFGKNDIYEPRVENRYVKTPAYYESWFWISTDYRKKFAVDATLDGHLFDEPGRNKVYVNFSPRYRFSDQWKIFLSTEVTLEHNDRGFVNLDEAAIIFGQRDRNTVINAIESQYIFNNKAALNLSFRHYYSEVSYDRFFSLQSNGDLNQTNSYANNNNTTYNSWNIDLRFSWWFAPGSQLTVLYRNAMESYQDLAVKNFRNNFKYLFDQPQINSLSVRVSYFLDYNRMKNWFGGNKQQNQNFNSIYHRDSKTGKKLTAI